MISVPLNPALARPLPDEAANRRTLAVIFVYFVIAGAATVMLGPVLPLLAARWALTDAQLGTLFVASYAGQVCGAWMAARRPGLSLLLGGTAAGVGFLLLATAGVATAHLLLFVIGLGLGAGLTAGNVVVGTMDMTGNAPAAPEGVDVSRSTRSRLLALLNLSWGLGAIACPLWLRASLSLGQASTGTMAAARGGGLFLLGLGVAFAAITALMVGLMPRSFYEPGHAHRTEQRLPWRVVWIFVVTLMLYVGVENALAGWLPTYALRLRGGAAGAAGEHPLWGLQTGVASSITLCFWISQLAGRGLMAMLVKPENELRFYRGCLVALIAAIGTLVAAPHWSTGGIFVLTSVMALCLAPLFPLAVSFLLARTGSHPHVGRVFASSSFGGSLLPWLTGVTSAWFVSLQVGFVVPGIGAALLLLLSTRLPHDESPAV